MGDNHTPEERRYNMSRIRSSDTKASNHMDELTIVAEWLRKHGFESISAVKTGMAGALRVIVPKLNNQIPFEENDKDEIETCFRTISRLIEAVNVFGIATRLSDLK